MKKVTLVINEDIYNKLLDATKKLETTGVSETLEILTKMLEVLYDRYNAQYKEV